MVTCKKILSPLLLLALAPAARAQVKEGKVLYERKVNMHRNLENQSMKNMIPEFNTSKTELTFSSSESLYKNVKEDEDIRDKAGDQQQGVIMKFGGGDDQVYKNYETDKMTEQRELGPKKYIIEDSLPHQSWKLEEGARTIKGYACKKATTHNRQGKDVIAWYTEDLRCSSGPEVYGGLPGLILELDIDNAGIAFTTLDITPAASSDDNKKIVRAPTNGKKISRQEFKKMMEDQFGPDSGGGVKIRIMRN